MFVYDIAYIRCLILTFLVVKKDTDSAPGQSLHESTTVPIANDDATPPPSPDQRNLRNQKTAKNKLTKIPASRNGEK